MKEFQWKLFGEVRKEFEENTRQWKNYYDHEWKKINYLQMVSFFSFLN